MFRKLLPALVAATLLASACAQRADDDGIQVTAASPIEALRAAPDRAQDAGTAHFEMTLSVGPDGDTVMVASGATDYESGQGSVTMDMGELLGVEPGADGTTEMVLADGVVYLRVPYLAALTGNEGWISASVEDLGEDAASLGLGGGTTDPAQLLETLRGVADVVTEEGRETVRGVETTRYVATIDLGQALTEAPADQRERLEALVDDLGAELADVPITVWVDDAGLPRRLTMELGFGPGTDLPSATMRLELFGYGDPVDIVVPSEDDVTPMAEVLGPLATVFGESGS